MKNILAIFEAYFVSSEHMGYTNSLATVAQLFKIAWHGVDTSFPGHEKTFLTSIEWTMKNKIGGY